MRPLGQLRCKFVVKIIFHVYLRRSYLFHRFHLNEEGRTCMYSVWRLEMKGEKRALILSPLLWPYVNLGNILSKNGCTIHRAYPYEYWGFLLRRFSRISSIIRTFNIWGESHLGFWNSQLLRNWLTRISFMTSVVHICIRCICWTCLCKFYCN